MESGGRDCGGGFLANFEVTSAARDPTKQVTDGAFRIILFTDVEVRA